MTLTSLCFDISTFNGIVRIHSYYVTSNDAGGPVPAEGARSPSDLHSPHDISHWYNLILPEPDGLLDYRPHGCPSLYSTLGSAECWHGMLSPYLERCPPGQPRSELTGSLSIAHHRRRIMLWRRDVLCGLQCLRKVSEQVPHPTPCAEILGLTRSVWQRESPTPSSF